MNDTFKRNQRWLTNASFLCQLVEKTNSLTFDDGSHHVDEVCDYVITEMSKLCKSFNRKPADINEVELHAYTNEALGGQVPEVKVDGIIQWNWQPIAEHLDQQIIFDINSLSSQAKQAAKRLINDDDIKLSLLFKLFKLSYLNRKVCLMAENVVAEDHVFSKNDANNDLLKIFDICQQVRSSSFSTPCKTALSQKYCVDGNTKTFIDVINAYKKLQFKATCPFSKSQHRLRDSRTDKHTDWHTESKVLGLTAGAALHQLKKESTLGALEHTLGLPERSDISGTTTDAIGLSLYLSHKDQDTDEDYISYVSCFVLSCMTTMSLSGHHSLSEVATAASLWSNKNYKPFEPKSVIDILVNLYKYNGEVIDGVRNETNDSGIITLSNYSVFSYDVNIKNWTKGKWQSLKLDNNTPDDLEFNDGLWWTAKSMVNAFSKDKE